MSAYTVDCVAPILNFASRENLEFVKHLSIFSSYWSFDVKEQHKAIHHPHRAIAGEKNSCDRTSSCVRYAARRLPQGGLRASQA